MGMRRWLLNAIVPPVEGRGYIRIVKISEMELMNEIKKGVESYIGHPATAKLLGVPVNRGEAKPKAGDVAFVVRLKSRPTQSGAEVEVKFEDLEIYRVDYLSDKAQYEIMTQGIR